MCSWNRRLSIIKRPVLPSVIYRFNIIPIKIPAVFSVEIGNLVNDGIAKE